MTGEEITLSLINGTKTELLKFEVSADKADQFQFTTAVRGNCSDSIKSFFFGDRLEARWSKSKFSIENATAIAPVLVTVTFNDSEPIRLRYTNSKHRLEVDGHSSEGYGMMKDATITSESATLDGTTKTLYVPKFSVLGTACKVEIKVLNAILWVPVGTGGQPVTKKDDGNASLSATTPSCGCSLTASIFPLALCFLLSVLERVNKVP
ncbi:hypothetical protein AAVH_24203 [Aphelenchoides avenae]|nr:hypothetical protein AAVH_24203 [Aphelenchus avenae]